MLSEIIKKKIEEKAGMQIRYSRDCEFLANKIHSDCNCKLSASTIRRLFGFIKGTKDVRVHTLDVIANYLEFDSWDSLIHSLNPSEQNKEDPIDELDISKLTPGEQFRLSCNTSTQIEFVCLGGSKLKITKSVNSKLLNKGLYRTSEIKLHHPLFFSKHVENGKSPEKLIEAKVSGVTSIVKIK